MRKRSYIQKLIISKVDGNDADSENEMTPEDQKSALITRGLGGKKNISDVDCCATRLRCTVVKAGTGKMKMS